MDDRYGQAGQASLLLQHCPLLDEADPLPEGLIERMVVAVGHALGRHPIESPASTLLAPDPS
ncbi:MAG: hypothetical protein QM804_14725 [Propionicimonas sp.]